MNYMNATYMAIERRSGSVTALGESVPGLIPGRG
jgi:hypothetical protein